MKMVTGYFPPDTSQYAQDDFEVEAWEGVGRTTGKKHLLKNDCERMDSEVSSRL